MAARCLCMAAIFLAGPLLADQPAGALVFESSRAEHYRFGGALGQRIEANAANWLVRAPAANPGLLAMFHLRDRQPPPEIVPWAGEFAGKYLLSAIPALRMTDNPELEPTVRAVVGGLIDSQAEDGYLGPFPQGQRLLAHWDLWGHYHAMLALMMWHETTGDQRALAACRKVADLILSTYLDTGRRLLDAGSDEMNLAVIHALARLYRKTGEPRYRRMAEEIEKDWQRAGDYLRTGLAGVEFFRTPRPRWESLHDLQGLAELYRISGDARYRTALLNHWHSIRRWDRRNTGGFSSGEQATGSPYEPTAIETCCTIAWMALTLDALRLAGDPAMADELELATLNGMLGAQHPSGNWWTYNTPMDGQREASADTIVFQARAGAPELNCCSVNAPRGLAMLTEWALMDDGGALIVNYYGPMKAAVALSSGRIVHVEQETAYPADGRVFLRIGSDDGSELAVKLRIPSWSKTTRVQLPGEEAITAAPGAYLALRRAWKPGDRVQIDFDMSLRAVAGDGPMLGRMSVYRGPLLLAFDVLHNDFGEADLPPLEPAILGEARASIPPSADSAPRIGRYAPWIFVDLPCGEGKRLRLVDFASAGAAGSRYLSWLPGKNLPPPEAVPDLPAEGARVPQGRMLFTLRPAGTDDPERTHRLLVAESPGFENPALDFDAKHASRIVVPEALASRLKPEVIYYWKLVAKNQYGETPSLTPPKQFSVDASLAPLTDAMLTEYGQRADGVVIESRLAGDPAPAYGALKQARGWKPASGPGGQPATAVELDGRSGMLLYDLRAFPSEEYSVGIWFSYARPEARLGQLFSAWCRGMDDPLRICLDSGRLSARIEAGRAYATAPIAVEPETWHHVCAVKRRERLVLYLDGKEAAAMPAPVVIRTAARDFALGSNPHYTGASEHLACRVAGLRMHVRGLSAEEVRAAYAAGPPK